MKVQRESLELKQEGKIGEGRKGEKGDCFFIQVRELKVNDIRFIVFFFIYLGQDEIKNFFSISICF